MDETGPDARIVEDGRAAIYINASYQNELDTSRLADLIHDFTCSNPADMRNRALREHFDEMKNTVRGKEYMEGVIRAEACRLPLFNGRLLTDRERMEAREDGIAIGREDGIAIGGEIERMKTVCRLLINQSPYETMQIATGFPLKELKEFQREYDRDAEKFLAKHHFTMKSSKASPQA